MSTIVLHEAQDAARTLAGLSAATVHEAYGRRGALDPVIKAVVSTMRVCAPAMTVRTAPGSNLLIHQALYHTPPGWVLVAATDGTRGFGYWGDIMAAAAAHRGVGGVVLDGGVRDTFTLRQGTLPIFAAGRCIRGTVKVQEGEIGRPVTVGGAIVHPGSIIVGDEDGVVCVPLELAAAVAAAARERETMEAEVRRELAGGRTTLDIYGFDAGPDPAVRIDAGQGGR